jgi:hypothetical protein
MAAPRAASRTLRGDDGSTRGTEQATATAAPRAAQNSMNGGSFDRFAKSGKKKGEGRRRGL